jgi:1-deoxy-D-xylulose-5-phosphate reductoisomerase
MALTGTRTTAPRRISILGSTGSIGGNTIDLVERNPDSFEIVALTANRNVEQLAAQARRLRPALAVIGDEAAYGQLKEALEGTAIEVAAGRGALVEAASRPAEWVMAAIVGAAGLEPTLAAIAQGTVVALANKECLVCAGDLVMAEVERRATTLLPVDSEHNAIYQVFDFEHSEAIERIILTASGGPFREFDRARMEAVTPAQAVAHPNWKMGAKISVDSATMMNKGLELIEAYHLFPLALEQIEVVVHPQSVVHSMVAYVDGSVLAQLGPPDMRTPIAFTLAWPDRIVTPAARLDLAEIGSLTFEAPDNERFPAISLARRALDDGGGAPTVLNAANEVAVQAFLDGNLGFLDIARVVEGVLDCCPRSSLDSIDAVRELDAEARSLAARRIGDRAAAQ